jgi:hypothetical protein
MNWIYGINWWYDDQPEPRRFLIFFLLMIICVLCVHNPWHEPTIMIAGAIGMIIMGTLRILPIFRPKKRQS